MFKIRKDDSDNGHITGKEIGLSSRLKMLYQILRHGLPSSVPEQHRLLKVKTEQHHSNSDIKVVRRPEQNESELAGPNFFLKISTERLFVMLDLVGCHLSIQF